MNSMRLYEIADQYQFLLQDLYDEETGEINEKAMDRLQALNDSIEEKCINITRLFKSIDAGREAIEKERKRMEDRERTLKNQVTRLKDYLLSNMERCEIRKIECPQFIIALQKNPESVEILDETQISEEYLNTKTTVNIKKIKEDLKLGVAIPGVRLVQKQSLRIR